MELFLILAIIITILFILLSSKMQNNNSKILILIIGFTISLTILAYPLVEGKNIVIHIINAIFYAIQSISINQDLSIMSNLDKGLYIIYMYLNFLILPILTASAILIIIGNVLSKFELILNHNKKIYVFSKVNEKSKMIAEKLQSEKSKKSTLIFANCNKEDIEKLDGIKSIKLKEDITTINFNKQTNEVEIYLIDEDEENNLNNSLELIKKYNLKEDIKIYIVNNSNETTVILDSTDKGKINVEIINETERNIYNLLEKYPLYLNSSNNTISVLIVGAGRTGREFLKAAVWCGQLIGYKLKINIVDKMGEEIKNKLANECKEMLENYDINFINEDIETETAIQEIEKIQDLNYILVSMESDTKNIKTAIMLRIQLMKKNINNKPLIHLWIENEYKKEQIDKLVNEKKLSYEINAFGSIKDMYFDNPIIDSNIEYLARQVHLSYDNTDTKFERYNKLEYNKKSSRATALHLKYKIYSILKEQYTGNLEKDIKTYENKLTPQIIEHLSKNEHDRWNAYMRGIGYTLATIEDVKGYVNQTNDYRNYLAKMSPALVSFEELDNIDRELSKILSKEINLKENDEKIVRNIPNILKSLCKKK